MLNIIGSEKGSVAHKKGIFCGTLVEINGEKVVDVIDYIHLCAEKEICLVIEQHGERKEWKIRNPQQEDIGLIFEDSLGGVRSCKNRCVFCFVDQLPNGMRETLYVKDDDWRMSFMMGNYVTLTNVNDEEFSRILRRKTSPLYISVHAIDDEVRSKLLGRKEVKLRERLVALKQAGITFHSQVVAVSGLNDGGVLEETIDWLAALHPYSASVAVVPVGLTRYHTRELCEIDEHVSGDILEIIHKKQEHFLNTIGTRFVFGADELYIRAQKPLPSYEEYEDFAQLEDGVGMIRLLKNEVKEALEEQTSSAYGKVSIATGIDAAPYISSIAEECSRRMGLDIHVYAINNTFFGESITVAGLLTGNDICDQLRGKPLGERLFITSRMLRSEGDLFLDDMTLQECEQRLGIKIQAVGTDGYDFVDALLG